MDFWLSLSKINSKTSDILPKVDQIQMHVNMLTSYITNWYFAQIFCAMWLYTMYFSSSHHLCAHTDIGGLDGE